MTANITLVFVIRGVLQVYLSSHLTAVVLSAVCASRSGSLRVVSVLRPPSRVVWDRVGSPVWKIKPFGLASRGRGVLFPVSVGIGPTACAGRESNPARLWLPRLMPSAPPGLVYLGAILLCVSRVPVMAGGSNLGGVRPCSRRSYLSISVPATSQIEFASHSSSILAPSLGASGHFLQLLLACIACTGRSLLQDCEHFGWGVSLLACVHVALWVEFAAA